MIDLIKLVGDGPNDELSDLHPREASLILQPTKGLYGAAVDIGTTTGSLYLVELLTGEVLTKAAEYNGQIKRGEDVISGIIYASKNNGLAELQSLVVETINELIERATQRVNVDPGTAGSPTSTSAPLGL